MWAFLRLVGSFLDFLPRAFPPPCIHFHNFFPVTFIPHPSKLQSIPSIRSPSAYSLRKEFSHRKINRWSSSSTSGMMKIGLFSFETEGRPEEPAERNEPLPPYSRPSCRETWNWSAARLTNVREALEAFYFLLWNDLFDRARSCMNEC